MYLTPISRFLTLQKFYVGVRYLKDTPGNAPALTELLFELNDNITTFNGWDMVAFHGLVAGLKAHSWVIGWFKYHPGLSAELWDAIAIRGDLKKGREVWTFRC